MNEGHSEEVLAIKEYVKSANLKGSVEITEHGFVWDLSGVVLDFWIDSRETTVCYSRRKRLVGGIGHFHEDNFNVINLIKEINDENKLVKITVFPTGSSIEMVDKTAKKKKSRLIVRHYYSAV